MFNCFLIHFLPSILLKGDNICINVMTSHHIYCPCPCLGDHDLLPGWWLISASMSNHIQCYFPQCGQIRTLLHWLPLVFQVPPYGTPANPLFSLSLLISTKSVSSTTLFSCCFLNTPTYTIWGSLYLEFLTSSNIRPFYFLIALSHHHLSDYIFRYLLFFCVPP